MKADLSFLGGASGRLLPVSIPLRFFGAAIAYHLVAWVALAASAGGLIEFRGGLGWPLAALHLFTLGVLGMTALGAGAQLLPVATRQPAIGQRWLAAIWWLYTPGVTVLTLGMGRADAPLLAAGAAALTIALVAWSGLMLRHAWGARGMPGVMAHAWVALGSMFLLLASALSLAGTWLGWPMPNRSMTLGLHLLFAPYGFMGMLALGLSYILIPMFAVATVPHARWQLLSWALAVAALLCGALAVFGVAPVPLRTLAWLLGTGAVLAHLELMRQVLAGRMRQALGHSLNLVKIGWFGLFASLQLAPALWTGGGLPRVEAWFGFTLAGVWLLSFSLGVLQRMVPFLASLHASQWARRAPTASSLTHAKSLEVHFYCHVAALLGLAAALALGNAVVATVAALAGVAGALAFGRFFVELLRRLKASQP